MIKFKSFYWWRYGEKDFDVIILEALGETSARLQLKLMIPSAYDINLLKKNMGNQTNRENQSNVERFHAWMERMNNVYLADRVRMARAYHIVATN